MENRTQLLHDFGALMVMWGEFELAIEIKIGRITKMTPIHNSITIGSLGFGTKHNVLICLLHEEGDTETIKAVKALVSFTGRNALVHSIIGAELDHSNYGFFHREVKNQYKVIKKEFTADSFHDHFEQFRVLHDAALKALGIQSEDEFNEYGREARFDGLRQ